mgnify:CR=1 FL=1
MTFDDCIRTQAGLANGGSLWLEQGKPPKKDAVNVSVMLWLPEGKPLGNDSNKDAEATDPEGGIPLQDMSKKASDDNNSASTNPPLPDATTDTEDAKPKDTEKSADADAVESKTSSPSPPLMDAETILSDSAAMRRASLLSVHVFEAVSGTKLRTVKQAVLEHPRVRAAVERGLCGDRVRDLQRAGTCVYVFLS